jgi:hypothetical protein
MRHGRVRTVIRRLSHVLRQRKTTVQMSEYLKQVFGSDITTDNLPTDGETLFRWAFRRQRSSFLSLAEALGTDERNLFRSCVLVTQILAGLGERAPVAQIVRRLADWQIEASNNKYVESYD